MRIISTLVLGGFVLLASFFVTAQGQNKADSAQNSGSQKAQAKPKKKSKAKSKAGTGSQGEATDPKKPEKPEDTESEKLLDTLIKKLEALEQYTCDLRQDVSILGYKFQATGKFIHATENRMRFELTVHLTDDTTGSLLEVCDGHTRWRSREILDQHEIQKLEIDRILAVLDDPVFDDNLRTQLSRQLGFAGLAPLMRGLRASQVFDNHEEAESFVFYGKWREEALAGMVIKGQPVMAGNLPEFLPQETTLWISKETGWPTKLEMRGKSTDEEDGVNQTVVTMEFLNPRLTGPLEESLFVYRPPTDVKEKDLTDRLEQQLKLVLQQTKAMKERQKKAEAATGKAASEKTSPGTVSPESSKQKQPKS